MQLGTTGACSKTHYFPKKILPSVDVGTMHAVVGINQFLQNFYAVSGNLEQYAHADDIYSNSNPI